MSADIVVPDELTPRLNSSSFVRISELNCLIHFLARDLGLSGNELIAAATEHADRRGLNLSAVFIGFFCQAVAGRPMRRRKS